jgi:transcriptional regulator with XRE-family HTH domain
VQAVLMDKNTNETEKKSDKGTVCRTCGQGLIAPRNARGTTLAFRDEPIVPLTEDIVIPICSNCGEMRLNESLAEALDAVLERSYGELRRSQATVEISRALAALHASQSELERMLGLSAGYVSKLLRGEKITSATVIRFLHVLNAHPRENLDALAEVAPVDSIRIKELRA